jgi:hypothetical protein
MSFGAAEVDTAMATMHVLETAEADIAYDVHGALSCGECPPA